VGGPWELSDAWVFASIEGNSVDDGYALTQVIAKGDGINHAVISEAEFCKAVPRLVAAGLIGADSVADRYWHTDKGRELHERCMKRRGLFGWIEAIPPALRGLGPPQDGHWDLSPGAFDNAVGKWHRRAQEILARLDRRQRRPPGAPSTPDGAP
jgi:hypothetical protein